MIKQNDSQDQLTQKYSSMAPPKYAIHLITGN